METRLSRLLVQALSTAVTVISLLSVSSGNTIADDTRDRFALTRGQSIAERYCAPCHAVTKSDAAPARSNEDTSFRDLHRRFPIKMLTDAAKSGTIEGHDEMPAFYFSDEEITALLLYIDSFAPDPDRRYIAK